MAFFSKSDGKGIDRYFIELDDTHKHWLLYKWPDQAIRTNTRLTVDADYHAVFTNRGTVIATLEPGAHVLNNGATPVISSIADALTGGKHSDVELFFVSTKLRPAVPFVGPVDAVAAHDLIMDVRVFGDVTYHISDPQTFVTRMAGTAGNDIEPEVNEVVRAQVLAAIREEYTAFTADGNVLASGANQDRAEELVIAKANATLADIGIAVEHFGQLNINIDPTDLQGVFLFKWVDVGADLG